MRYLKVVILFLAYALIPPAFAQTCCPAGCVQNAPNQCVTTGPIQNSCGNTFTCPGGSPSPSGGSNVPGSAKAPVRPGPQCISLNPTKADVDNATNKCISDLTGNAILVGCFFENDAGRAEDERTGLSCSARQAALAKQCRKRCADYASASTQTWCADRDPNFFWPDFFGDIWGEAVGSARVELCGPSLRDSFFNRAGRSPPQRPRDNFFSRAGRSPPLRNFP